MEQPKGGFDSHEVSEKMFNEIGERTIFETDHPKTIQMMKDMVDAYQIKLDTLGSNLTDIFSRMHEPMDPKETDALIHEFNVLDKEWTQLKKLVERLQSHTQGELPRESLN